MKQAHETTPQERGQDAPWYTPTVRVRLADGSTLLRPGKPVQRANATLTSKWTGVSKKNLRLLAEGGWIRECQVRPRTWVCYPAEIAGFIERTEKEPDFWNDARRAAYITARRLRDHRWKTPEGKIQEAREEGR